MPRWIWLDHVPEGLPLTAEQRAEVRRRLKSLSVDRQRRLFLGRRIWKRLLPALLLITLAFFVWLIWHINAGLRVGPMIVSNLAGVLLFQILIWLAIAWSINRGVAPLYWTVLNDIGVRVCVHRGYIMERLPPATKRCPECGEDAQAGSTAADRSV